MKNKIYLSLAIIAVLLGSIGWTVSAQKTGSATQTWEYKVITVYGTNDLPPANPDQLNQMGTQGWELVTILPEQSTRNGSQQRKAEYFFKRAR